MKNHVLVFVFFFIAYFGFSQLMRSEVYDFSVGDYFGVVRRSNAPSSGVTSPINSGYFMHHILTKQLSVTGDTVTYSAQRQTYIPSLPTGGGGSSPASYLMDTISFTHKQLNTAYSPEIWDDVFGIAITSFWDSDTNECYKSLDTLIPSPLCINNSGVANHFGMQINTMDSCSLEPLISDYYAYSHAGGPYGGKQCPGDPTSFTILYDLFYVVHNGVECGQFPDFFLNIERQNKLEFSVFPNPVQDKLQVQGVQAIQTCVILTADGKLVQHQVTWQGMEIDVSQLASGLYLLQLTDANGNTGVVRFVK